MRIESTKKLEIFERFFQLRKKLNLTQDEFAQKLGISRNYVHLIEAAKKNPGDGLLTRFAELENKVSIQEAPPPPPALDLKAITTPRLREIIGDITGELDVAEPEQSHRLLLTLAAIACELASRSLDAAPRSSTDPDSPA